MSATVNGNSSGPVAGAAAPKIHLYTHHDCPYAHRAHIALNELGLPFEETLISLDKPRDPWYLEINPRGLVPSIKYSNGLLENEILTESGVVVQFLADMRPSHLAPASLSTPEAPLVRARMKFFIDTFDSKIAPYQYPLMKLDSHAEKEAKVKEWLQLIEKEIEPQLTNARPYFGGSEQMTLAEVNAAPFVLRWYALSDDELIPKSFTQGLDKLPNFSKWAAQLRKHPNITDIYDGQRVRERIGRKVAQMKADGK